MWAAVRLDDRGRERRQHHVDTGLRHLRVRRWTVALISWMLPLLLASLLIRNAFRNRPVRPSDCQPALVGGGWAALACPRRCSRPYTRRSDQHGPVVEVILGQGFIRKGDLITRPDAARSVGRDFGEVEPASARSVCGVDHSYASVVVPLSDGPLACHAPSMRGGAPNRSASSRSSLAGVVARELDQVAGDCACYAVCPGLLRGQPTARSR